MTTKFFKRITSFLKKLNDNKSSLRGCTSSQKLKFLDVHVHRPNWSHNMISSVQKSKRIKPVKLINVISSIQDNQKVSKWGNISKTPRKVQKSSHNSRNHEEQKQTQTFIKSNIELNCSRNKNGGPKNRRGIQTTAVLDLVHKKK